MKGAKAMKGNKSNELPHGNEWSFLSAKAAATYLGITPLTLIKWRMAGRGPHYFKLGRNVRYRINDLNEWIEERRRLSTSDKGKQ